MKLEEQGRRSQPPILGQVCMKCCYLSVILRTAERPGEAGPALTFPSKVILTKQQTFPTVQPLQTLRLQAVP